jgi:cytochrome c oxidase subunit 3
MSRVRPQEQYADLLQQSDAAQLGMWVFIATEVMFCGSLIFSYAVYRAAYTEQFERAGRDSLLKVQNISAGAR